MQFKSSALIALTLALGMSAATAADKPPMGSMSLSDVAKSLESKGYSPITEISMDDGVWEVETYKDGHKRELKVAPATAEVISDRPDD